MITVVNFVAFFANHSTDLSIKRTISVSVIKADNASLFFKNCTAWIIVSLNITTTKGDVFKTAFAAFEGIFEEMPNKTACLKVENLTITAVYPNNSTINAADAHGLWVVWLSQCLYDQPRFPFEQCRFVHLNCQD